MTLTSMSEAAWRTVWILVSMLRNCSSSLDVSARIMGCIWPVFRHGTWNTSFNSSLVSIKPDHENRWIKLEKRNALDFLLRVYLNLSTYPFLSLVIWESHLSTSGLVLSFWSSLNLLLKALGSICDSWTVWFLPVTSWKYLWDLTITSDNWSCKNIAFQMASFKSGRWD